MNNLLRFFLAILAIISLSSTIACSKSGDGGDSDDNGGGGSTLHPKGKVTSNGVGIANVVVTDGTFFAKTAADGSYDLPFNDKATHVYISTPAGYTVAVNQSAPMFWQRLADVKDRNNIDFSLIATGDDTRHRFVAVGDPQIRNVDAEKNKLAAKCTELANDIAALGSTLPVHIMVAGDVAFNNMEIHPSSRASFSKLNQPVYYAIGNHDHAPTGESSAVSYAHDKTADAVFIRNYGPTCYSFNRGKVHYIIYDNIYFKGGPSDAYDAAYITPEQLKWIEKDLSYVEKSNAVILLAHAPTQTRKDTNPATHGNSDKLHALVRGYAAVQFISGHTHYNTVVEANNTIEHVVGALCGAFWTNEVGLDGTVLGYKFFEVDGTNIKWKYIATGTTYKDTQFSVFTKSTTYRPLSDVSLVVNVWDWDPMWKVQYSVDNGANWSDMTQLSFSSSSAYDPMAYTTLGTSSTDGKPSTSRQWINASTTDHLFTSTVDSSVSMVKIKVTTRFGEELSQDITL